MSTAKRVDELPALAVVPADALVPVEAGGVLYKAEVHALSPVVGSGMNTAYTADANAAALLAAVSASGTVDVAGGTYAFTSVALPSNTWLRMSPDTVLDISAAGSVTALTAAGMEGAALALTANAAVGAMSLTMSAPDAATLARGDWIRVASNAVFDASSTSSKIGEIVEVASVVGTTVTLETPLRGGPYNTADTAVASKITFVENVRISGGRILGGGTVTSAGVDVDCNGVSIFLGKNCLVEGVNFDRCDLSGVWFRDSIFCKVARCHFKDAVNDQQAYGVLFDSACQDCIAESCTAERVRHIVTTGNSTATKGITRRILFSSLKCYSSTPARGGGGGDAFDTHTGAEDLAFVDCASYYSTGAGFNIEAASCSLTNCEAYYSMEEGFTFHNESDKEGVVSFDHCRSVASAAEGFRVTHPTRGSVARIKSARLSNCRAEDTTGISFYIANTVSSLTLRNVTLSDCVVTGCKSASASVWVQNAENSKVDVEVSEPTQVAANLIRIRDCTNLLVIGCSLRHVDSSNSAIAIYLNATGAGSCTKITVEGNRAGGTTPTNLRGLFADTNATNCRVGVNDFQECNTALDLQAGTGHRIYQQSGLSADNGDTSPTLTVNSLSTQRFNTPLTTNRTVTAPTASLASGLRFRVVREAGATGASTLTAFGKALAVGQWVEGECDGSAYRQTAFGSL